MAPRRIRVLSLSWVAFTFSFDTWVLGFSGEPWVDRVGLAVVMPFVLLLVLGIAAQQPSGASRD